MGALFQVDMELRAAKAKLQQVRRELREERRSRREEAAVVDADLKMFDARLQALLPVYWAAMQVKGSCKSWPAAISKKDWDKFVKALRAAQKVLG